MTEPTTAASVRELAEKLLGIYEHPLPEQRDGSAINWDDDDVVALARAVLASSDAASFREWEHSIACGVFTNDDARCTCKEDADAAWDSSYSNLPAKTAAEQSASAGDAFRLDVRAATEAAARSEAIQNDTYVALVSGPVVRDAAEWSEPVIVRMVHSETKTGMVEIEVRRV